jgi:hypothetical protein
MVYIDADILIYGGSFSGCAAALKAARSAPRKRVILINPEPLENKLGGIGTIGGQNFMDKRMWKESFPQKGSFERWRESAGDFYNVDQMSDIILKDLMACPNIKILFKYDIEDILAINNDKQRIIKGLILRKIYRNSSGYIVFNTKIPRCKVFADVFIDASNDGKLARLTEFSHTVGRYDWPCKHLDCSELINKDMGRQQVATLMFKITGVKNTQEDDMSFTTDQKGSMACWGGNITYRTNQIVKDFNNKYGPLGYALKPINAAQNGANSKEWWANCLLVFDVDGRAYERDRCSWRYPSIMRSDYKNVDEAWVRSREFLKTRGDDFLKALRQYPGFAEVNFVYSNDGYPVVGEVMYLRETIHIAEEYLKIRNETENINYALTSNACIYAGDTCNDGMDAIYYGNRVGLGFYWTDINAYKFSDLKDKNGEYVASIVQNVRPEIPTYPEITTNPVFIPLSALIAPNVPNLLASGYAIGVSAFGWAELRVIPNLCVTGDAAGIVAAYTASKGVYPVEYSSIDILKVQKLLIKRGNARLDK